MTPPSCSLSSIVKESTICHPTTCGVKPESMASWTASAMRPFTSTRARFAVGSSPVARKAEAEAVTGVCGVGGVTEGNRAAGEQPVAQKRVELTRPNAPK